MATTDIAIEAQPSINRRVFQLAWPVIAQNLLETLLGIVDTLLVSRLGDAALAGTGAATQFMFILISLLSAISIGSTVLVAQAIGAHRSEHANTLAKQSLIWGVLLAVPLSIGGTLSSSTLMHMLGVTPEVAAIGASYLQITFSTSVFMVLLFIASSVLRGAGDSRTPMQVTILSNIINAIAAYGLIFGHWGLPQLGAVGSAWGALLGRAIAVSILVALLFSGNRVVSIRGRKGWMPSLRTARSIFAIGVPAGVEQVLSSLAFSAMLVVVATLGTHAIAAQRITMNALSLSFLPGFGFALAATALVGQSIGARRPSEGVSAAYIAMRWAMIWMGIVGLIFFFLADFIVAAFNPTPEAYHAAVEGMRIVAIAQPFWAILFVLAGGLRGAGNTRFPMVINAGGLWLTVVLGWIGVNYFGLNLTSIWIAFVVIAPLSALANWWRFRSINWETVQPAEQM